VHGAPQVRDVQHGGQVHGGQVRGAPDVDFGATLQYHGAPSHEKLCVHRDDLHVDDCYAPRQAGAPRVHGALHRGVHRDVHRGGPPDQGRLLLAP